MIAWINASIHSREMTRLSKTRRRILRFSGAAIALVLLALAILSEIPTVPIPDAANNQATSSAAQQLAQLDVKGRAAKTGYSRDQFGSGWASVQGCSVRQIILYRDVINTVLDDECRVVSGVLLDPYTAQRITFDDTDPDRIQIDHVVALSDAWQKGAQSLSREERVRLANDPLNLLAVDGPANQEKGDGDAATWLPPNKAFRCDYVARQVAVKSHYQLWVTAAERDAMARVLEDCPSQGLPS